MIVCDRCGTENEDGVDFCRECKAYLRWEPTQALSAITTPEPKPAPEDPAPEPQPPEPRGPDRTQVRPASPRPPPDSAALVLRAPEGEPVNLGALEVVVPPGETMRVLALVRNQSRIVDHYDLTVDGLPEEWWTAPPTSHLAPFGSRGTYEEEVEFAIHPPRTPEATARAWEVHVVARSTSADREVARAPLTVTILPFAETTTTISPQRARGWRSARFRVALENHGNAPALVALDGTDPDGRLQFGFDRPPQQIPMGTAVSTAMRVRAPRLLWFGRRTEHRFELATLTGDEAAARVTEAPPRRRRFEPQVRPPAVPLSPTALPRPPKLPSAGGAIGAVLGRAAAPPAAPLGPSQAAFVQRAFIPRWLIPLLLLIAIPLAAFVAMRPDKVAVPDVTKERTLIAATAALSDAGLTIVEKEQDSKRRPGTILGQSPEAGKKIDKGAPVTVFFAKGTRQVPVPAITGLSIAEADAVLRKANLTLQAPEGPELNLNARITGQLPAAGTPAAEGTLIRAIVAGSKDGGGKPRIDKAVALPAVAAGMPVAEAVAALKKAGVTPVQSKVISPQAAGTVAAMRPPAGTPVKPGDTVTLVESAGSPRVAFEDGNHVFTVDALKGAPEPFTTGQSEQKFPTWSPDGKRLAYVSGGQVIVKQIAGGGSARPVTPAGETYANLSWAPSGDVIAMTRIEAEPPPWLPDLPARSFCLGRLVGNRLRTSCKDQPDIMPGRAIHWSRDGRTLLAFANAPKDKKGVVRWRTTKPFSPNERDWRPGRFVGPPSSGGKYLLDAALSPDGTRLALVANFSSDFFQVYLTAPNDFRMNADPRALNARGCKLAWRSDSRELAVVDGGPDCMQDTGAIATVPVAGEGHSLTPSGDDPSYQPVDLGG